MILNGLKTPLPARFGVVRLDLAPKGPNIKAQGCGAHPGTGRDDLFQA